MGTFDDGNSSRHYGHALVVGLSRFPKMLTRRHSHEQLKKTRVKSFIKMVNFKHFMPTRYKIAIQDLKSIITSDSLENTKKRVKVSRSSKKILEEEFKSGKSN